MPVLAIFSILSLLSLSLKVASATEAGAANGDALTAATEDCVAASATNSIIQGRVDVLAGVELKVHPESDVAKTGRGEWIIWPGEGCTQEDLEALAENMPKDTRAVFHGHPKKGGLCFFVMEGTREGVWQKLIMHRWKSAPQVETDTAVHFDAEGAQESEQLEDDAGLSWGLDRIDDKTGLDGSFEPMGKTGGSGVDVYVMDTGIRTSHTEFEGRAVPTVETFQGVAKKCQHIEQDCAADDHGHGTFCAAVVGGRNFGVARQATLRAVKVHDGQNGTLKNLHLAFDWLLSQDLPTASTIFTLSLSANGPDGAMMNAFRQTNKHGITTVVAAGNVPTYYASWADFRPIKVAATDRSDNRWPQNAAILDIYAPGVNITSAWVRGSSDSETKSDTGTSAAAAFVAGAAALLLSEAKSNGLTFSPADLEETLKNHGTDIPKKKKGPFLLPNVYEDSPFLYIGPAGDWMSKAKAGGLGERTGTEGLPYPSDSDSMRTKIVLR